MINDAEKAVRTLATCASEPVTDEPTKRVLADVLVDPAAVATAVTRGVEAGYPKTPVTQDFVVAAPTPTPTVGATPDR